MRGIVLYAQPWDDKQNYVDFERLFPVGIVHFLLVDEGRNILSERLVFSLQKVHWRRLKSGLTVKTTWQERR